MLSLRSGMANIDRNLRARRKSSRALNQGKSINISPVDFDSQIFTQLLAEAENLAMSSDMDVICDELSIQLDNELHTIMNKSNELITALPEHAFQDLSSENGFDWPDLDTTDIGCASLNDLLHLLDSSISPEIVRDVEVTDQNESIVDFNDNVLREGHVEYREPSPDRESPSTSFREPTPACEEPPKKNRSLKRPQEVTPQKGKVLTDAQIRKQLRESSTPKRVRRKVMPNPILLESIQQNKAQHLLSTFANKNVPQPFKVAKPVTYNPTPVSSMFPEIPAEVLENTVPLVKIRKRKQFGEPTTGDEAEPSSNMQNSCTPVKMRRTQGDKQYDEEMGFLSLSMTQPDMWKTLAPNAQQAILKDLRIINNSVEDELAESCFRPFGILMRLINVWCFDEEEPIIPKNFFDLINNRLNAAMCFSSLLTLASKQYIVLTSIPGTNKISRIEIGYKLRQILHQFYTA